MKTQNKLKKVTLAVSLGLLSYTNTLHAQEQDTQAQQDAMEEVVVVASRLKGSTAAVIEERKNQAFVADILGADEISRTGDSDAASALRRVTGLTLVDGKFIYVRGLGERYSSARLNGASIPSPDLTRNVVPLDIFPASIIESLSVQKVYSPSMPAAFGGGNVDIRTKTVPKDFTAGIELGAGYNSNSGSGNTYNRNDDGIPEILNNAIVQYKGDFSLRSIINNDHLVGDDKADQARVINSDLLKSLPRNMEMTEESLDPNYGIKAHIGNSFDENWFGGQIGFLLAGSYKNEWNSSNKFQAVLSENFSDDCSQQLLTTADIANSCFNTATESLVTTASERLSGVLSLGYEIDTHSVSLSEIYLADSDDTTEVGTSQSPNGSTVNTIFGNGQADRVHEFSYEDRELRITQAIGQHTFLDYGGLGFDWQYTESTAKTEIPMDVTYKFDDSYVDGAYSKSEVSGDDNRVVYSFIDLEDNVKSYGGNLVLPVYAGDYQMEFKAGYDFTDKARLYNTSSFAVNNDSGVFIPVNNNEDRVLGITSYLTDELVDTHSFLVDFNEPTAPDADDYLAAQKIDAYYGEFDVFYDNKWRISGGIRYEEFKQVSVGTSSLIFSKAELDIFFSPEKIENGTILSHDFFPALSMTYMAGSNYQIRIGYGETVVRPDIREVVPVAYYDPLTDIRTIGRSGLESSPLKNYDARFEYYGDNGDNYSIAAFYKDIESPIENVLSVGDEDYTMTFVNGETAEVYGIEMEWLHSLTWLTSGLFTSGNITLSDSEVSIDPAYAGNLTNSTKRMTGHSKYVVNFQLGFDSDNGNHSGSLLYNVFGERILASGVGGREDAFEQPFNSLDVVYTYYPSFDSTIKLKAKNILGEDQDVTQSDITVRSKEVGTIMELSYKYEF
jgi:hypothetical protein